MIYTIHFIVTGRVQGVFFRSSCKGIADRYHIKGWVRNLADGRVEGVATAEAARMDAFRDWLNRGPDMARVFVLEVTRIERQDFDAFEIR